MGKKVQLVLFSRNPATSSTMFARLKRGVARIRIALGVCTLASAALLSACAASTSTPAPTSVPMATSTPVATSAPQQTGAPTSLDPCQLVTSKDASSLAGTTFGAGMEDTTPGGGKICWYGYQTTNVFMVLVGQEKDAATAQADKAQFQTVLESKMPELANAGIQVTELPNFADGGATGQGSLSMGGQTINGSDFGFIKGATFIGLSDLVVGQAAPSSAAWQVYATTLLGQLP